jgi:PhnB protein
MPDRSLADRVARAIEASAAREDAPFDRDLQPFVAIAERLFDLPRPSFRARLKADLLGGAKMTTIAEPLTAVRQTATPRLRVKNAPAAIDFYKKAFGARELMRFTGHGRIAHAELAIGNSVFILAEEAPEYGFPGPEALGGSPVAMQLYVDDADGWVDRAVAAGARLVMPVSDQFYGDRSGSVRDPFGYAWGIATRKQELSVEEMQQRMAAMEAEREPKQAARFIPRGFRTVTPYLVVPDVPSAVDFVVRVFGAEETHRSEGSGGTHAEVRIGDSMLMIGGSAQGSVDRPPMPTAMHVYVEDTDAAYRRALEAGASSISEPADQPYGERGAGVKDGSGNVWYIATAFGDSYVPAGLHSVNVYLHPHRAEPLIAFLQRALGATDVQKYASPEGIVRHASVHVADSVIEMGEAAAMYQPMPTMFYVYVADADAAYIRALQAGATSLGGPADQPYGDRTASVKDPFGNEWYFATQLRETRE